MKKEERDFEKINRLLGKHYYNSDEEINWGGLLNHESKNLTDDFIIEFWNKLDFEELSTNPKLSLDVIRKFKDKVNWGFIAQTNINLTEDFIREFKDWIIWPLLTYSDKYFTADFIDEFKNRIDWEEFSRRYEITEEIAEKFFKYIDWYDFFDYNKSTLPDEFFIRNINKFNWNRYYSAQALSCAVLKEILKLDKTILNRDNRFLYFDEYISRFGFFEKIQIILKYKIFGIL